MGSHQVLVPGGLDLLGSDRFYPEERPAVEVAVGDVWWDPRPVTNAEFAAFVDDSGYVTIAERELDPADFPGADPALLVPGSQVFTQAPGPVPLHDWTRWWRWQPGAQWRHPDGPASDVGSRPGRQVADWTEIPDHPVVHVGWEDALAYVRWAGKDLPTEAEWEHAARGGLVGADYAWGDELSPDGRLMANTWQGQWPWRSDDTHGHDRTSPVASYPPNGHGLYDMVGNVWEWTRTPWTPDHRDLIAPPHGRAGAGVPSPQVEVAAPSCCGGSQRPETSTGTGAEKVKETDRMVTKGGSHLCSPHYCRRYRPAARQGHGVRDTTSHVGFRCVVRTGD